ncbi:MAG: DUF1491 family protein [Alphaproteobacteria bacterium]|nr:DUF1491 family protein [Alphaproteobacteria bacterium]
MRLTSDLWVRALMRRVFADGGFAAIEKAGSPEAGAIFIKVRDRSGEVTLLGPAPQSLFEGDNSGDRLFEQRLAEGGEGEAAAVLVRETNFDPDLWVVEIETDHPGNFVEITPAAPDV